MDLHAAVGAVEVEAQPAERGAQIQVACGPAAAGSGIAQTFALLAAQAVAGGHHPHFARRWLDLERAPVDARAVAAVEVGGEAVGHIVVVVGGVSGQGVGRQGRPAARRPRAGGPRSIERLYRAAPQRGKLLCGYEYIAGIVGISLQLIGRVAQAAEDVAPISLLGRAGGVGAG